MRYYLNYYADGEELEEGLILRNKKEVDDILRHKDDMSAMIDEIRFCKIYKNGNYGKINIVRL